MPDDRNSWIESVMNDQATMRVFTGSSVARIKNSLRAEGVAFTTVVGAGPHLETVVIAERKRGAVVMVSGER